MRILFTLAVFITTFAAHAQQVRLNTYSSFVFDDRVESFSSTSRFYRGTLQGGWQWGAALEYKADTDFGFGLSYQRLDSEAPMTFAEGGLPTTKVFELGTNLITLSGIRFFDIPSESVEPFAAILGGMANFNIKNPEPGGRSNVTRFSWGGQVGANVWINRKVAIKLQAQFISVVQAFGGGAYFGSGGSGVTLSSYSTVFQFGLGGGLVFKLTDPS